MTPKQAAETWGMRHVVEDSPEQGLINKTYVIGSPPEFILQWVNPIFSPLIHKDLTAIIAYGQQKGLTLPNLISLPNGNPCLEDPDGGCWRVWEFIPGKTIDKLTNVNTAAISGKLVADFHRALFDMDHQFIAPTRDVHNTPQRMRVLQETLGKTSGHALEGQAKKLGESILKEWESWDGELNLPKRICHGDLKISNLRFSKNETQGICLLDLDTIGPQSIDAEMGDAWRSWCNPAKEDEADEARFNIEIFRASATAYLRSAPPLSVEEKGSLVTGISRICLELAARFCTDALENSYFKEDRIRFPQPGQHNLLKAQSQFKLAQSVIRQRLTAEKIITNTTARIS